jgi:hypothetical protein
VNTSLLAFNSCSVNQDVFPFHGYEADKDTCDLKKFPKLWKRKKCFGMGRQSFARGKFML